jgi:hypothetical protein
MDVRSCASTNATANCAVDAGLTLTVAAALDVAPAESVTCNLKVNEVNVATCGAMNEVWAAFALVRVTAGPATCVHE